MGSFANSLHVKSNDAGEVITACRDFLLSKGFQVTDEAPDVDDAGWGASSSLRALHVCASHNGWVGVLDSDFMSTLELGADLSKRLQTYAVQFMVNDSDSWHYQLFENGSEVDAFDSIDLEAYYGGDFSAEGALPPEVAGMLGGGLPQITPELMQKAQQIQQQMEKEMPPEIRAIQDKMHQETATPEEMQQLTNWTQSVMQQLLSDLNKAATGRSPDRNVLPFPSQPIPPPHDGPAPNPELDSLRPLLQPGVTEEQALGVMGKQAVFAEEVLAEFLPLIGIPTLFAHLSYRYLSEMTEGELGAENVYLVEHLKFQASR